MKRRRVAPDRPRSAFPRMSNVWGSLPTEDLNGNPITILWTWGAPESLDDPTVRDVIELVRQFVTRFNNGEKVVVSTLWLH